MNTSQKQEVRRIVNNLLQDVDNEAKLDTETANAICGLYTGRILKLITQHLTSIAQEIEQKVEHYEDKSDERYGFARMWNTMLSQLDDDIKLIVSNHIKELGE